MLYEIEDNGFGTSGNRMSWGDTYRGSLSGYNDVDFYQFSLTDTSTVEFEFEGSPPGLYGLSASGNNFSLVIQSAAGDIFYTAKPDRYTGDVTFGSTLSAGTYFVKIANASTSGQIFTSPFSGQSDQYTLQFVDSRPSMSPSISYGGQAYGTGPYFIDEGAFITFDAYDSTGATDRIQVRVNGVGSADIDVPAFQVFQGWSTELQTISFLADGVTEGPESFILDITFLDDDKQAAETYSVEAVVQDVSTATQPTDTTQQPPESSSSETAYKSVFGPTPNEITLTTTTSPDGSGRTLVAGSIQEDSVSIGKNLLDSSITELATYDGEIRWSDSESRQETVLSHEVDYLIAPDLYYMNLNSRSSASVGYVMNDRAAAIISTEWLEMYNSGELTISYETAYGDQGAFDTVISGAGGTITFADYRLDNNVSNIEVLGTINGGLLIDFNI